MRQAIVDGNDGEMRDLARLAIAAFGRQGEGSGVIGVDVQRIRRTLGLTAGASAPELLVRELVDKLAERFDLAEREVETTRETIAFKLPRGLSEAA